MEFVMIVEPDEVGRKRLEAVFQTEKPSFSYQITGRPEEALDILEHQKTDVLVCETSLSVLSGNSWTCRVSLFINSMIERLFY